MYFPPPNLGCFQQSFFFLSPFSLLLPGSDYMCVTELGMSQKFVLRSFSSFSEWIISMVLSSTSLTFSSAIFNLLLSSLDEVFILDAVLSYNFYLLLFHSFHLYTEISPSFHSLRSYFLYVLEHIIPALKSLLI